MLGDPCTEGLKSGLPAKCQTSVPARNITTQHSIPKMLNPIVPLITTPQRSQPAEFGVRLGGGLNHQSYRKRSFAGASGTIGDSEICPFHTSLIAGMTRSMASCET